jgi:nucleobase transporter 1/2
MAMPCTAQARCAPRVALTVSVFFQIVLAMLMMWLLCFILTETGVFSDDPKEWGYGARTDTRNDVLNDASWFRVPYPGIQNKMHLPVVMA